MKKAIVLFAAVLIIPITAYAQGGALVKLSAELDTGVQDVITFSGSAMSDAVSLYDVNTGMPSRFRIGLGVGSMDGNWGITDAAGQRAPAGRGPGRELEPGARVGKSIRQPDDLQGRPPG